MAKPVKPLSEARIKSAKAQDKLYRIFDGDGLCLKILKSGNKVWEYRYKSPVNLKDDTFIIGPYPEISLAEARQIHREKRSLVISGIDPKFHEDDAKTFKEIFNEWYKVWGPTKNKKYAEQSRRYIQDNSMRRIGGIKVDELTVKDISSAIQPFIKNGTLETAKRMKSVIAQAIDYAISKGLLETNPARVLSTRSFMPANKPRNHHRSLDVDQIYLMNEYFDHMVRSRIVKNLVELLFRTLARAQEICKAKWEYVDFENRLLIISPEIMKKSNEHIIPLSDQAFKIIEEMKAITGDSRYIFPKMGKGKKPHISVETPTRSLTSHNIPTTTHGFRSLASTVLYSTLEYHKMPDIVIEECLAHQDTNTVRAIYNRSKYIDQKRKIFQFWSDFVDSCDTEENNKKVLAKYKIIA